MSAPPSVGAHPDIPAQNYHSWPILSSSVLREMRRGPAWARRSFLGQTPQTEAMELGELIHCAVLEPERWKRSYTFPPAGIKRNRIEGNAAWSEYAAEFPEAAAFWMASSISPHTRDALSDRLMGIRREIREHPVAGKLLAQDEGRSELSLIWRDDFTGRSLKTRVDRLTAYNGYPTIVELKTTRDARRYPFAASAGRLGYHMQAAIHLDGCAAVAPMDRLHFIVAVEKAAPFGIMVYQYSEASIELGREQYRDSIQRWMECEAKDEWPTYPPGIEVLGARDYREAEIEDTELEEATA